jgi:type I restriction enzyme S subunit
MVVDRDRVGNLLSLKRRIVTIELEREYEEIGIRSFGRGIFHKEPITGLGLGSKRVFWIEPNDLVISNVFAWEGALAVASHAEAGKIGSHRFMTFVPVDERINTSWAAWFFQSEPGLELIRKASPGSAGRNRTLAIERFRSLDIPLPPIREQQRVAAHLDRAMRRVQTISQRSTITRPGVAAFVAGWLDAATKQFGERRPLADIADVVRGRGPRYEQETGFVAINQGCVRWGSLDLTRTREVAEDWWHEVPYVNRVRAGDVLVNSTGEGTIGRVALAGTSAATLPFDSHVLVVRCEEGTLLPAFLTVYLRSRDGQRQVDQAKGANTTKQTELGKTRLERFRIPVPGIDEQKLLVARFHGINDRVRLLEEQIVEQEVRLSAVIPSMLNDAFGGLS